MSSSNINAQSITARKGRQKKNLIRTLIPPLQCIGSCFVPTNLQCMVYLFLYFTAGRKGCYRCVVMHEKHKNVLQYKETFCHRRDALPHLCSLITGDALLYSMFRENADPVDCPLKGPFSFTYNRGHGDCKSPVSSIESCTEDSRLLLNYQACPDVYGSESTVEELECLATWKEGSLRFLVGKLHHNHATSNEDRYRCFVYEKTNVSVRFNCQFPTWMTFSHTWHTLDFTSNYTFYQRNATLRITNQTGADIKVYCVNVKASSPSGNSVALVAHWQHHCNPESKECPYSGKYEIQNRRKRETRSSEDNSSRREKAMVEHNRRVNGSRLFNFSVSNMSSAPMLRSRRESEGEVACVVNSYNRLEVGCNSVKNMEFYSTSYTCHGGWYENGASFVVTTPVTRDSTAARRYCFVSREQPRAALALRRSATNCERTDTAPHLVFDATATGECQDQTSHQQAVRISLTFVICLPIIHYVIPR
ncbi:hypothetical protein HF086_005167 [Spodoptera exigua]|uniref:Uncharacterized protein n=1 Tax=Spodoptera exigua TaxID=7107 RepID=A0A922MV22_SPOEX|nr:hypothetical protein HF086_005167 [Spodoptera exigua]